MSDLHKMTLPFLAAMMLPQAAMAQTATSQPSGEPRDRSVYFSNEQMQAIADSVSPNAATGKAGAFSKRLIVARNHSTAFIRLTDPDVPHSQGGASEIFVIREGGGILETGGTITGITGTDSATHRDMFIDPNQAAHNPPPPPRKGPSGDLAGTAIEGGVQQSVKAGDIVLIPAGVAHHWIGIDRQVVYLDIKFPRGD